MGTTKRVPKPQVAVRIRDKAIIFTFYTGNYTKNLPITEKKWKFGPKSHRHNSPLKSNKSRSSGFKSQHKPCFLTFIPKSIPKYIFFKHQNPISILGHIDGTGSGLSWFVNLKMNVFKSIGASLSSIKVNPVTTIKLSV